MTGNQEEELVSEQMGDQPGFLTILFTFFSGPCVATFQLKFSMLVFILFCTSSTIHSSLLLSFIKETDISSEILPFLSLFCNGLAVLLKFLKIFATCISGRTEEVLKNFS